MKQNTEYRIICLRSLVLKNLTKIRGLENKIYDREINNSQIIKEKCNIIIDYLTDICNYDLTIVQGETHYINIPKNRYKDWDTKDIELLYTNVKTYLRATKTTLERLGVF
jgi:hypothetical protein